MANRSVKDGGMKMGEAVLVNIPPHELPGHGVNKMTGLVFGVAIAGWQLRIKVLRQREPVRSRLGGFLPKFCAD
jgi:hypothetical protein